LFVAALVPRLSTTVVLTSDETNLWRERVAYFVEGLETGNLLETHQAYHPGVVTLWLGSMGLALDDILHEPNYRGWNPVGYFAMLRLPLAVFNALAVGVGYLLLRRLFNTPIALLAGLFWAFDPFDIAHSQILHTDAVVTSLAFVTTLCALIGLGLAQDEPQVLTSRIVVRRRWWIAAAVLFGFTLLAKFNGILVVGALGLYILLRHRQQLRQPRWWLRFIGAMLAFGVIAAVVFVVAYPAMWVAPVDTFLSMFTQADELAQEGHLQYYFGQVTNNPGMLFYLVTTAFRITPLVMIGLPLGIAAFFSHRMRPYRQVLIALGFYLLVFWAVTSLQAKKLDRYVLPIFPGLDLVAALGFVWLGRVVLNDLFPKALSRRRLLSAAAYGVLALLLVAQVVAASPYYMAYYNPLLGGTAAANDDILLGWGEGLDQAGAYITQISGGNCRGVVSGYSDVIQAYIPCQAARAGDCVYRAVAANPRNIYVTIYISQIQRQYDQPLYEAAHGLLPRKTVKIGGVDFAYVYAASDLDLDMVREAGRSCRS
jgi:hypothetical protein